MSRATALHIKLYVRPVKTRISLRIQSDQSHRRALFLPSSQIVFRRIAKTLISLRRLISLKLGAENDVLRLIHVTTWLDHLQWKLRWFRYVICMNKWENEVKLCLRHARKGNFQITLAFGTASSGYLLSCNAFYSYSILKGIAKTLSWLQASWASAAYVSNKFWRGVSQLQNLMYINAVIHTRILLIDVPIGSLWSVTCILYNWWFGIHMGIDLFLHKWKYMQAWHLNLFSMTRAEGRGFQHLPRDLANVNALKNHVWSLLLHKNWEHLLHFALFLALFCFAFSPMSRERNFHWLCSF